MAYIVKMYHKNNLSRGIYFYYMLKINELSDII